MYPSSYQPAPGENVRYFNRGNTWDGHGGNAEEHRKEMRKIAEETIKDLVPQMAAEIFDRAIETAIGAIEHIVPAISQNAPPDMVVNHGRALCTYYCFCLQKKRTKKRTEANFLCAK